MNRTFLRCTHCGALLKEKNLKKHLRKVHPMYFQTNLKGAAKTPSKKIIPQTAPPKKFIPQVAPWKPPDGFLGQTKQKSSNRVDFLLREKFEREICPRCMGDGGARGGCQKCDGTGWISEKSKQEQWTTERQRYRSDNSRVSNANYLGNNQGAHYRERDGRIGSNPEHDDYSDESFS